MQNLDIFDARAVGGSPPGPSPAAQTGGPTCLSRGPVLLIPQRELRTVRRLAEASYPFEACGLLLGQNIPDQPRVEALILGRNLATGSLRRQFVLDPEDYLATDAWARATERAILGVWHSHPGAAPTPSESDREAAWKEHLQLIVAVDALGHTQIRAWHWQEGQLNPLALLSTPRSATPRSATPRPATPPSTARPATARPAKARPARRSSSHC